MAVTLEEAKVGMADKVDQQVIDTLRRNSAVLDAMTFDDAVSPGTGGSTLTYGYVQLKTPATAAGRRINEEYTPQEAKREKKTTDLVVMGGSYEIDRVIAQTSGAVNEVAFQTEQKTIATVSRFHHLLINGDASIDTEFNGLAKLAEGTDSEIDASDVDLTMVDETSAGALVEALDEAMAHMLRKPDMILANSKTISKLKSAARILGYKTLSEDAFGRTTDGYDGVRFVDVGQYFDGSSTKDIIPVTGGASNIYLVNFGLDALHGVTPKGDKIISVHTPDFTEAKAVHKGDVEFVAGVALKNSRALAVLKGVKVTA